MCMKTMSRRQANHNFHFINTPLFFSSFSQTPSRCPAEPPVKQGSVDEGTLSSIMTEAMVDTHSLEEPSHDKVLYQSVFRNEY